MHLRIQKDLFLLIIVLWSIAGFPLLAAFTSFLSLQGTNLSIAARGIIAVLSLWLALTQLKRQVDLALLLFLMFWIAYALRLVVSLGINNEATSNAPAYYWIWAIGVCALPALAVSLSSQKMQRIDFFRPLVVAIGLAGTVVLFAITGPFAVSTNQWGNREALENLNPISVGSIGASTFLCGLVGLSTARKPILSRLLFIVLIILGISLAILANSRGPVVAGAIATFIFAYGKTKTLRGMAVMVISVVIVISTLYFSQATIFDQAGIASRFSTIAPDGDLSSIQRFISLGGAVDQFIESPIFGDGVEEKVTQFYPHNLIVEAFMATGLIGGVPFLALFVIGMVRAVRLTLGAGPPALVGILTIQQAVAVQFSGAIYASGGFWVFLCLAIAFERQMPRYRPVLQQQRSQYIHTGRV